VTTTASSPATRSPDDDARGSHCHPARRSESRTRRRSRRAPRRKLQVEGTVSSSPATPIGTIWRSALDQPTSSSLLPRHRGVVDGRVARGRSRPATRRHARPQDAPSAVKISVSIAVSTRPGRQNRDPRSRLLRRTRASSTPVLSLREGGRPYFRRASRDPGSPCSSTSSQMA